jgi:phytoene synthase
MNDWASHEALLTEGYRRCARITWRYGTTYFWGAALLRKPQRKHVYAVYALCRLADDIVDLPNGQDSGPSTRSAQIAEASPEHASPESDAVPNELDPTLPDDTDRQGAVSGQLKTFAEEFRTSLAAGSSADPVMAAVIHTVITRRIDPGCFDRFFNAMAMDLTTSTYQTWEDLRDYMEGSAAVIGEMMLPVLEPISEAAKPPARSLGLAFQLTNFLRDVGEDLDRGRIYLPQDDLRLSTLM